MLGCDYGDGHDDIDSNCNVEIWMEEVVLRVYSVCEKFVNLWELPSLCEKRCKSLLPLNDCWPKVVIDCYVGINECCWIVWMTTVLLMEIKNCDFGLHNQICGNLLCQIVSNSYNFSLVLSHIFYISYVNLF